MIGETVGSYRITDLVSEGGMGVVYRAEHVLIGRPAAVKVLLPHFSSNREIVQRFFNEAKVTSSIRHPGIIEIFDFGYHASGQAFLVMEFLAGESLAHHLAKVRTMDESSAAWLIRTISGALAAAHERGVVHRDLKPDNIFLVPDPDVPGGRRPKILDFGIAKLAQAEHGGSVKTRTGAVMGTPAYMSPEQCRGTGDVDQRADLYSVGCILYELVCGRPPFVSDGAGEIIGMHLHVAPESPRKLAPHLSPTMEALILLLLAKKPEGRPASAADLIARLDSHYGRPATLTSPAAAPERPATSQPHKSGTVAAPLPTPVPKPTTLGGSASEAMSVLPPRRRWPFAAAAVAVALAGGVVAAVMMKSGKGGSSPSPSPTTSTSTSTKPEADPVPVAVPVPVPVPDPVPDPVPVPVPVPVPQPPAVVVKPELPQVLPSTKRKPPVVVKKRPDKKRDTRKRPPKETNNDPIETKL